MAAKKAAKKTLSKKDTRTQIIRTEDVPLKKLKVYHDNPRIGNVDKIAKSLHLNGQYKPIVVNIGTETGRPNEILAGNHTYLGARKPLFWTAKNEDGEQIPYDKPAWETIVASFVDVDEARARAIVIADNKTADDGTYDEKALARLLSEPLPELAATGYELKEFNELMDKFKIEDADLPDSDLSGAGLDTDGDEDTTPGKPDFGETDLGDELEADENADRKKRANEEDEEEDDPEGAGVEITKVTDEIKGAFDLKDEMIFDSIGYWNIPRLRKDMLMQPEDLPENLTTWAGSATRHNDDPDTWWLYNYGVDSTSGMKDVSKVIVSFYTYDEYFDPWWWGPAKYVSKVLNSGIKFILTPDFTDETAQGHAFCLYQLYRARWMGRYFQEAGLKVLPNISWPDQDIEFLEKYTLKTLPKDLRMISMQCQTYGDDMTDEHKDKLAAEFQLVMDTIKPEVLLLYSGQPGYEFFMDRVKTDAEVKFLLNRQAKLSAARKGRDKKTTL
jgi:hypothetical protein